MRGLAIALALVLAGCNAKGKAGASARVADAGARLDAEAGTSDASPAPDVTLPGPAVDALPASSDDLTTRARHLLEAIAKDDPSLATDIVFPRDAYVAAKDAPDPGKQWDDKVMSAFQREVHLLHKRTKGVERAELVSLDMGAPISQVVPKKRDMKIALWQVRHSRLSFTIDGKASRFDLQELMSWRGAWYVLGMR